MTDRFDILARTTSLLRPKDEEEWRLIRQLVYNTNQDPDTPFRRQVDFWFAAIAWTAMHDLPLPDDTSGGTEFVKVGRGTEAIQLAPWMLTVIQTLHLCDQNAFLSGDLSDVDTTGGPITGSTPIGNSVPITVANRYALAGSVPLRKALTSSDDPETYRQLAANAAMRDVHRDSTAAYEAAFGTAI